MGAPERKTLADVANLLAKVARAHAAGELVDDLTKLELLAKALLMLEERITLFENGLQQKLEPLFCRLCGHPMHEDACPCVCDCPARHVVRAPSDTIPAPDPDYAPLEFPAAYNMADDAPMMAAWAMLQQANAQRETARLLVELVVEVQGMGEKLEASIDHLADVTEGS